MFRNRIVRWTLYLAIGFGLGSLFKFYHAQNEMDSGVITLSPDDQNNVTILKRPTRTTHENAAKPLIGGAFTLVDHTGKTVTEADYAGQYKLVFFGFTFCPAICPTELQKVNVIMSDLGDFSKKVTPIFITIDPERDTVEQMAEYVAQYHPRLVGLTGSREQIDAVTKAYKVYATKVENDMMDGYMMNHSAFLYFMGPEGELLSMYPATDTADVIARNIQSLAQE